MNSFLTYLNHKQIYIISPHLDDAVLSCGQLICSLRNKADIVVINVFTTAHGGPYTISARIYLHQCSYVNALRLYTQRVAEDRKVLSDLGVRVVNLGFTDALFRKNDRPGVFGRILPELNHMYPTYRRHVIGRVNRYDHTREKLQEALTQTVPVTAVIFSPLGIGGHIDHRIVNAACTNLFRHVIYYSEFPYSIHGHNPINRQQHKRMWTLDVDPGIKEKSISQYKTQKFALFSNGPVPEHKEIYYSEEL